MRDIMLDIETLGTAPGCVILSIGAAEFSATDILNTFHVHIDPTDSVDNGLIIEPATVMWWFDQSKAAQSAITSAKWETLLDALNAFIKAFDWTEKRVWCNGAAFDFPILNAAFKKLGLKAPWPYYNEMDMRTLKGLVGKDAIQACKVVPTIAHDGLADAVAQAKTLQNVFAEINAQRLSLAA